MERMKDLPPLPNLTLNRQGAQRFIRTMGSLREGAK